MSIYKQLYTICNVCIYMHTYAYIYMHIYITIYICGGHIQKTQI